MNIVHISDMHGMYRGLKLPPGDMIVCSGDFAARGTEDDIIEFIDWFKDLKYKYKIFIAGNHDRYMEVYPEEAKKLLEGTDIIYLNDSGVTIKGIKFWGSPVQPQFNNWAFNRARNSLDAYVCMRTGRTTMHPLIKPHWDKIPEDTDVLITHGPPAKILDEVMRGPVGCEELAKAVARVKPEIHMFGHIHEGYGELHKDGTSYYNGSCCDANYRPINEVRVIYIEDKK